MSGALDVVDTEPGRVRVRVRTPGKHIVLFSLAVTFMICLSTLMLARADLELPAPAFAAAPKPVEETFIADLAAGADGRMRLLRMTVEIHAADAIARRALEEKLAAVRERLAFFLRELTPEDLDGGEAQDRLKAELKRRVDLSLAPASASEVAVRSLVIQ